MQTYIALLRGINVGGQKKIKMAELRAHLSKAGFEDVKTYIQSGNICCRSTALSEDEVSNQIQNVIRDQYGFEVPTMVLKTKTLQEAFNNNPYTKAAEEYPNRTFIAFLNSEPEKERIEILNQLDYSPDELELKGKYLYFHCPNGAANSKISNNLFESKLKVSATTRNVRTVGKLLEMVNI